MATTLADGAEVDVIARVTETLPKQGAWTLQDYDFFAARISEAPWLEFSNGRLVQKAMPLLWHSSIALAIFKALDAFVSSTKLGLVYFDGTEFRIDAQHVRLPDVLYVSHVNAAKRERMGFTRIDLAVEVLSAGTREEDLGQKRRDYASGGVAEYWLADPDSQTVTVLKLNGAEYVLYGEFGAGEQVTSALLSGFSMDVNTVFGGLRGD